MAGQRFSSNFKVSYFQGQLIVNLGATLKSANCEQGFSMEVISN